MQPVEAPTLGLNEHPRNQLHTGVHFLSVYSFSAMLLFVLLLLLIGEVRSDTAGIEVFFHTKLTTKDCDAEDGTGECIGFAETLLALEVASRRPIPLQYALDALAILTRHYKYSERPQLALASTLAVLALAPDDAPAKEEASQLQEIHGPYEEESSENVYDCPTSDICEQNIALWYLDEWIVQEGGRIGGHMVHLGNVMGSGVIAPKDLPPGAVLARVPSHLQLTTNLERFDLSAEALIPLLMLDPGEQKSYITIGNIALALNLLLAYTDPFFDPFFECIPDDAVQSIPLSWTDEELTLLGRVSQPLGQMTIGQRNFDRWSFIQLLPHLEKHLDPEVLTGEMWLWALAFVRSRAVGSLQFWRSWVLIPGLDRFNHRPDGAQFPNGAPLVTQAAVSQWEEIYTRYFEEPCHADTYVFTYGFVPAGADSFTVALEVPGFIREAMAEQSQVFRAQVVLKNVETHVGPDVTALLMVCRLLAVEPAQFSDVTDKFVQTWESGRPLPARVVGTKQHRGIERKAVAHAVRQLEFLQQTLGALEIGATTVALQVTRSLHQLQLRLLGEALSVLQAMAQTPGLADGADEPPARPAPALYPLPDALQAAVDRAGLCPPGETWMEEPVDESLPPLQRFESAARSACGVTFQGGVHDFEGHSRTEVVAAGPLPRGAAIALVPAALALTPDLGPVGRALQSEGHVEREERELYGLAIRILSHAAEPWAASPQAAWARALPPAPQDLPLLWAPSDLEALEPVAPWVVRQVRERRAAQAAAFRLLAPELRGAVPERMLTEDLWHWACAVAQARSVAAPGPPGGRVILPLLDSFGHSPAGEALRFDRATGAHAVAASRDYAAGERVYVQQRDKAVPADTAFLQYGAVVPAVDGDGFRVELEPADLAHPNWGFIEAKLPAAGDWKAPVVGRNLTMLLRTMRVLSVSGHELLDNFKPLTTGYSLLIVEEQAKARATDFLVTLKRRLLRDQSRLEGLGDTVPSRMTAQYYSLLQAFTDQALEEMIAYGTKGVEELILPLLNRG